MKKLFAKSDTLQNCAGKVFSINQHQVVVEETIAEGEYEYPLICFQDHCNQFNY